MSKIAMERATGTSADRAFEVFTGDFKDWWPAEYTWSGPGALADIGIEGGAGGLCYEIGPHGFRCDWGRVLTWDPPRRLVFTWQIGPQREPVPDPSRAGEIEVRFRDDRIEFEHRDFEKYGPGGDAYRNAMESPRGWPSILDSFVSLLNRQ